VNEKYRIDWYNGKVEKVEAKIDFRVLRRTSNGWHAWVFLIQTRRDEERILQQSLRLRNNEVWIQKTLAPEGSTRSVDAAGARFFEVPFNVILQFCKGDQDLCSTAKVHADDIRINAHFFDQQEIENDIDPREFKSIKDHEKLMEYLTGSSTLLNRQVIPFGSRNASEDAKLFFGHAIQKIVA